MMREGDGMVKKVYCPLGMMRGEAVECVEFNAEDATCYLCPLKSLDGIASNLDALCTVLNDAEAAEYR